MTRASLGRTAARTYPSEIRAAHGEEVIGTLLDAGEHSVAMFGRELTSLVAGGLAARSRKALSQPLRQISLDLVRWTCIVIVARELAGNFTSLRWGGTFGGSLSTVWLLYAGPALILTVFTAGRDRTTGIIGLIWLYTSIRSHPQPPISIWIEFWVPPLAAFMLMAIRPRRKAGCERALCSFQRSSGRSSNTPSSDSNQALATSRPSSPRSSSCRSRPRLRSRRPLPGPSWPRGTSRSGSRTQHA